jgi:hypothetical protein
MPLTLRKIGRRVVLGLVHECFESGGHRLLYRGDGSTTMLKVSINRNLACMIKSHPDKTSAKRVYET